MNLIPVNQKMTAARGRRGAPNRSRFEALNGYETTHQGMESRLQAAGRGNTRSLGEFSTRPAMLPPHRLKPELHTRMRKASPGQSSRTPSPIAIQGAARSLAAFTMIEIALSLAVIGFALVAIIGVLPFGMNVQRDNRENTIINYDADYLMSAIRNGAQVGQAVISNASGVYLYATNFAVNGAWGQDELTNYIICITNTRWLCHPDGSVVRPLPTSWYTNTSVGTTYTFQSASGTTATGTTNYLVSGANIIGILSTPKYIFAPSEGLGYFISNYITADFRAITGSAVDMGTNQASKDFAFRYRVYPENIPSANYPYRTWFTQFENFTGPAVTPTPGLDVTNFSDVPYVINLQNNLSEIRLRFRWPVLGNGGVGPSHLVFRSTASGVLAPVVGLGANYYYQSQTLTPLYQ